MNKELALKSKFLSLYLFAQLFLFFSNTDLSSHCSVETIQYFPLFAMVTYISTTKQRGIWSNKNIADFLLGCLQVALFTFIVSKKSVTIHISHAWLQSVH